MKNLIFIFLLSVFLAQQNHSQSFTKLYKEFISDSVFANKNLFNSLEINLERNSKLNPDLIYSTLESYNIFFDKKISQKLFENLKSKERIWLVKRADWAKYTLSEIIELGNDELTNYSSKLFKKLLNQIINNENDTSSFPTNFEKEQQSFYSMIYYTNDSAMTYDKNLEYEKMKIQIQHRIKEEIEDLTFFEKKNFTTEEFLKTIIDYWYLFEENKNSAFEIISDYYKQNRINDNRKQFSVLFNTVYANDRIGVLQEIEKTWKGNKSVINESTSIYQLSLGIAYKIFFNKSTFPFSYLDVQTFYAFGTSDAKLNSYGIKLTLPLFYHDIFYVEVSSIFTQNEYSYKPYKDEYKKEIFYVIPTIDASIDIYKGFGTEFSFGFKYSSINIFFNTSIF